MSCKLIPLLLLAFISLSCEDLLLGPVPENNARSNIEILWKTFDENYPLFIVKKINWDSIYNVYAAGVPAGMPGDKLWNTATAMLLNLNDGHVKLYNEDFSKMFDASINYTRVADDFSLNLIKNSKLESYKVIGAGLITYGKIKNKNIGYIHIAAFTSNSGNGMDWAYEIDTAVKELTGCDAIIVDVRNNGGGLKATVNITASVFVNREITYFFQQTKTGPAHSDLSGRFPITIGPSNRGVTYTKNNVLLTNRFSASGAEYFTQIFKYLPYSTQIGDTTFGAFGDIIDTGQLPNGWTFHYPCRLTTTPEGTCYEGKGIVPDHLVENTAADIKAGKDNVINFAINYLLQ